MIQGLLQELVQEGKIKARTKWKEIYPLFKEDNRYLDMLGNPGSNPLELFWDIVDGFDQQLEKKITIVEDVIKNHNEKVAEESKEKAEAAGDEKMEVVESVFRVLPETTWDQFAAIVNPEAEATLKGLNEEELRLVYNTVCSSNLYIFC